MGQKFHGMGVPGLSAAAPSAPLPKLLNRNFYLLIQAQTVSMVGNQAYAVAMVFWIKHTTNSASLIGLLGMMSGLVEVVLGPLGGTLADRYPRRRLLVTSDVLNGAAVFTVAAMMYFAPGSTGAILAAIIGASIVAAVTTSFFHPAISASVPDLVPKDQLQPAVSVLQGSFQGSALLGQALAGSLFQWLGAPLVFLLDAITFWFASLSESFIQMPPLRKQEKGLAAFKRDTRAGVRYVWTNPGLRSAVLGSSLLNFLIVPVMVLAPFFVEDTLKAGPVWYGYLMAAQGVGSLGGFALAGIWKPAGPVRGRAILWAMIVESAGFGALAFVRSPLVALAFSLADGVVAGFVAVSISAILQVTTPREFRGRVFGLLRSIAGAAAPLGMGLAGIAADILNKNIPLIYGFCGGMMTVTALCLASSRNFRSFVSFRDEPAPDPERTGTAV